ncbi:MAG: SUMF1/EgtB/PvdO family nonheme iron enzyme [Myxococcales bacterium]|nr:SUMF1/EgtB/PvdO family nonheme iron enzyme [Myxococcales bacterium]MCB9575820.1 SUMF1/EgtB/PvdO family nonheme iron enzyme [Polyangiaceae bacterium]
MADLGEFCIDKHEATQEEYEKFLVAVGTTPSGAQPVGCQANSSFHPNDHCAGYFQPQTKWNHAVGCVDWCDAYAYCKWAGKHLCSSVSGQVLTAQTFEDYSASQWGYACSNGGQTDYPYGATLQPQNCMSTVDSAPVGSYAQCTGLAVPFNQVFDMVGSVAEWIDYCDVNQGCALMGRLDTPNDKPSSCTANTYALKLTASETTGIRCCL